MSFTPEDNKPTFGTIERKSTKTIPAYTNLHKLHEMQTRGPQLAAFNSSSNSDSGNTDKRLPSPPSCKQQQNSALRSSLNQLWLVSKVHRITFTMKSNALTVVCVTKCWLTRTIMLSSSETPEARRSWMGLHLWLCRLASERCCGLAEDATSSTISAGS